MSLRVATLAETLQYGRAGLLARGLLPAIAGGASMAYVGGRVSTSVATCASPAGTQADDVLFVLAQTGSTVGGNPSLTGGGYTQTGAAGSRFVAGWKVATGSDTVTVSRAMTEIVIYAYRGASSPLAASGSITPGTTVLGTQTLTLASFTVPSSGYVIVIWGAFGANLISTSAPVGFTLDDSETVGSSDWFASEHSNASVSGAMTPTLTVNFGGGGQQYWGQAFAVRSKPTSGMLL